MLYVDRPAWPGRGRAAGRLWAHLVSDVSFAELHAFAELLGAPRRGFERDHYDVPESLVPVAIWLGARQVSSRELLDRLTAAGLRRPKRRGGRATPAQGPASRVPG
ncbi:MAG TPA: DUF4031 domain-containing protein [Micromonosporaceae bacterium]